MTTRSVGMEALLYLAAQRQVADAIRIAGIKASTSTVAVILFGGSAVDQLIALLGWSRDDGVLDARGKDLSVLGVRKLERGTVPEDRLVDLALERTALLDVLK
jgi:tRNA threonylcarbamoyladenosine modification (KEOPS) complex Cgi121 subunit